MNVSDKLTVPGEWTSDVVAARACAVVEKRPVVVVVCKTDGGATDCTTCLRLEKDVFAAEAFAELMRLNEVYLVYLQARSPVGMQYMTGCEIRMPVVTIYDTEGRIAGGRRIPYNRQMDTIVGFNNMVQERLAGTLTSVTSPLPAAQKPWWMFWK